MVKEGGACGKWQIERASAEGVTELWAEEDAVVRIAGGGIRRHVGTGRKGHQGLPTGINDGSDVPSASRRRSCNSESGRGRACLSHDALQKYVTPACIYAKRKYSLKIVIFVAP